MVNILKKCCCHIFDKSRKFGDDLLSEKLTFLLSNTIALGTTFVLTLTIDKCCLLTVNKCLFWLSFANLSVKEFQACLVKMKRHKITRVYIQKVSLRRWSIIFLLWIWCVDVLLRKAFQKTLNFHQRILFKLLQFEEWQITPQQV